MARISLKQKGWNAFKRQFEKQVCASGGSFGDAQRKGGKVWSVYRYMDRQWATMWHGSYSDSRAQLNMKSILRLGFHSLGLSSKASTQEVLEKDYEEAVGYTIQEIEQYEYENDNDVYEEEIVEDAETEIVKVFTGENSWLDESYRNERNQAVRELFERLSSGVVSASVSSLRQEYQRHSGIAEAIKSGVGDDGENEDYGIWLMLQAEIFLHNEVYLKNTDVFWMLHALVWGLSGGADKRWEDVWNRYDRRTLHIKKRVEFCEIDSVDGGAHISDYLNQRNMKQDIIVYRYFFAKDGECIRESNDKEDDRYEIQYAGRGYAYSLSKTRVQALTCLWLNQHFIRKAFEGDEEMVHKVQQSWESKGELAIWDGSTRAWIGTYKIKKADIVGTVFSEMKEEEIIADKARLIRYEVATFDDCYASMLMRNWHNTLNLKSGERGLNVSMGILYKNEKELHKIIKAQAKLWFSNGDIDLRDVYLKRNREKIKSIMKKWVLDNIDMSVLNNGENQKDFLGVLRLKA
jgi:hypothetical protein